MKGSINMMAKFLDWNKHSQFYYWHYSIDKLQCNKGKLSSNGKQDKTILLCYAEIKYSNWLKLVTWIATTNQSAFIWA